MSLTWALVQSLVHPITNSLTVNGRAYDLFAPKITVHSQLVASLSPAITGAVDDPTASIVVVVGGASYPATNLQNGTWVLGSGSVTLLSGANIITVKATDPAGNAVVATGTITVDVTAPALSLTTNAVPWNAPGLSGTIDDDSATVVVTFNSTQFNATVSNGTWHVSAAAIGSVVSGTVPVTVTATDQLGNVGTLNAFVTVAFEPSSLFSNGEQGWWYDPNDLTEEKINWRRNLLTHTEQFDNAVWVKTNITVQTNTALAPDGSMTADKLVAADASSLSSINSAVITVLAGTAETQSWFIKAGEVSWVQIIATSSTVANPARVWINAATGTVGTNNGGFSSVSVASAGNGWYRVTATFATSGTSTQVYVAPATGDNINAFSGDGVSGFYVWGAQLEAGTTATHYQKITDFSAEFMAAFPNHTLFQDHNGTTPVTGPNQPVGLQLDKSRGLILKNESLSGAWSNPAGVWAYEGSDLRCTATTNAFNVATLSIPVAPETWQKVQFTVKERTAGNIRLRLRGTTTVATAQVSTTGMHTFHLYAPAGAVVVDLEPNFSQGFSGLIGGVSVRELPGNHRYQTAAASRPMLRQTPILGPELVVNGTFDVDLTSWSSVNVGTGTSSWSSGALSITRVDTSNYGKRRQTLTTVAGKTYRLSFSRVSGTTHRAWVGSSAGAFDLGLLQTANYLDFTAIGSTTWLDLDSAVNATTVVFDNISVREITGYYTDRNYLEPDGADDWMQTNPIDFTGTDKVTLFAGVRKLSDATRALIAEISQNSTGVNPGSFGIEGPGVGATPTFRFTSQGSFISSANYSNAAISAPVSSVITGAGRIATDTCLLRISGSDVANITSNQGTGTYGNYPAYFFRRGGVSLPFNGHEYGSICVGRLCTPIEIISVERMLAPLIGVAVP